MRVPGERTTPALASHKLVFSFQERTREIEREREREVETRGEVKRIRNSFPAEKKTAIYTPAPTEQLFTGNRKEAD